MADEIKRTRRIAIISGKGGVGKTVITANLAASLSSLGRRILVIDADLGLANLDILLGVEPKLTIHDALHGLCTMEEAIIPTAKGFDLLPAGSGLPEGALLTSTITEQLESTLSSLESRYDAILFDAGAGVGDVVLHFADLAHEILLVVTPEPTSLMDAYATIKILHQQYKRNDFLLIVNQANPAHFQQTGVALVDHLRNITSKFLGTDQPVRLELIGSIPRDPAIPHAIMHRQLLREINPQAPLACLINQLAGVLDVRVQ